MSNATLLDYLHQLQRNGVTHVPIEQSARDVLRELYTRGSARRPLAATTTATQAPQGGILNPTGSTNAEKIASLAAQAENWPAARALQSLRETMVFSTGNPQASLVLVGEAPGFQEEQKKEPFVGPAGEKLNQILKAMGLSRQDVYLTNICKFRPGTKNQTTNNRKPSADEMAALLPFLQAEIDIIKPQVIVALGATAAQGLLHTKASVGELRNSWHQFQGIPLRVTFHPSYLLRQEDGLSEKRKLWEDMLQVMEKIKLPISDKQRAYFTS